MLWIEVTMRSVVGIEDMSLGGRVKRANRQFILYLKLVHRLYMKTVHLAFCCGVTFHMPNSMFVLQ
jgi:hypothetical protein